MLPKLILNFCSGYMKLLLKTMCQGAYPLKTFSSMIGIHNFLLSHTDGCVPVGFQIALICKDYSSFECRFLSSEHAKIVSGQECT